MCKFLKVTRSLVYYIPKEKRVDSKLENHVIKAFKDSRNNYGTRKIKMALKRKGIIASRRKIGKIMSKYALISNYRIRQYKVRKTKCNEETIPNMVDRKFNKRKLLEVVVSDLTYVKVANKWHYICLLIDLHAREIIGHAVGKNKDAKLVKKAFYSVKADLRGIEIFHTDRGSEFKNQIIDEITSAFHIKRSLSRKGNPFDNAVSESSYNIIKTEFVSNKSFENIEQLDLELFDYVNWFNNFRLHGSLNYLTPSEFKSLSNANLSI